MKGGTGNNKTLEKQKNIDINPRSALISRVDGGPHINFAIKRNKTK